MKSRKSLSGELLDASGQAADLARSGVQLKNAFAYAAHNFRLCFSERFLSFRFVATCNSSFNLFHEGLDAAFAGAVYFSAFDRLANTFLRRFVVSHMTVIRFVVVIFYLVREADTNDVSPARQAHLSFFFLFFYYAKTSYILRITEE